MQGNALGAILKKLEELGWIRRVPKPKGRPGRVGIVLLRRADPSLPVATRDELPDVIARMVEARAEARGKPRTKPSLTIARPALEPTRHVTGKPGASAQEESGAEPPENRELSHRKTGSTMPPENREQNNYESLLNYNEVKNDRLRVKASIDSVPSPGEKIQGQAKPESADVDASAAAPSRPSVRWPSVDDRGKGSREWEPKFRSVVRELASGRFPLLNTAAVDQAVDLARGIGVKRRGAKFLGADSRSKGRPDSSRVQGQRTRPDPTIASSPVPTIPNARLEDTATAPIASGPRPSKHVLREILGSVGGYTPRELAERSQTRNTRPRSKPETPGRWVDLSRIDRPFRTAQRQREGRWFMAKGFPCRADPERRGRTQAKLDDRPADNGNHRGDRLLDATWLGYAAPAEFGPTAEEQEPIPVSVSARRKANRAGPLSRADLVTQCDGLRRLAGCKSERSPSAKYQRKILADVEAKLATLDALAGTLNLAASSPQ